MEAKESGKKQVKLEVNLKSDTPVVGIEINPIVTFSASPQHTLQFTWERLLNDKKVNCSVHDGEEAILQCIFCVRFDLPIKHSYHCSAKCYHESRDAHRQRHLDKALKLNLPRDVVGAKENDEYTYDLENVSLLRSKDSNNIILDDQDGNSWLVVGSSEKYVPSGADYGCFLRLKTVVVNSPVASHVCVTRRVIVAPDASFIRHVKLVPPRLKYSAIQPYVCGKIRVLSYNMLADMYVRPSNYRYCPTWALTWEYRSKNFLREISEYDPDILCLQEVQSDHFESFFKPEFELRGYCATYKKKNNEVFTGDRHIIDGCAIFFRSSKFRAVAIDEVVFSDIASTSLDKLPPNQKEIGRKRLLKDNIAQIIILEFIDNEATCDNSTSRICVANTHIHASEDLKDVKLWQIVTLINLLEKIGNIPPPILLCGDLNSRPGSAPLEFVLHGRVGPEHREFPDDPISIFNHLKLSHNLPLVNAYSDLLLDERRKMMNRSTWELPFTNFSSTFVGTLDYIFYSEDKFMVQGLLEPLDAEYIEKNTALPSAEWSSDHIALMADFCLIPTRRPLSSFK